MLELLAQDLLPALLNQLLAVGHVGLLGPCAEQLLEPLGHTVWGHLVVDEVHVT
jgi:hypothetical protein